MITKKQLYLLLTLTLFAGTVFAWYTVYGDFYRFNQIYGTITRIKDCSPPNPVTTPCFYGAFAFLLGFIISFYIYLSWDKKDTTKLQKFLTWLLIGSTIFAWGNFSLEIFRFYFAANPVKVSCSGVPTDNVFTTPCFIGASIFLLALLERISLKFLHPAPPLNQP